MWWGTLALSSPVADGIGEDVLGGYEGEIGRVWVCMGACL